MHLYSDTFQNKKVLVTGHTGFKGSWLTIFLNMLGAEVFGISDKSHGSNTLYEACNLEDIVKGSFVDIRDRTALQKIVLDIEPDFIFHLAAQALVGEAYDRPVDTFETNAIGTLNILEATRQINKSLDLIMITSDKVYRNLEVVYGYRENDIIGGYDPYSASKGAAELIIDSYMKSFFNKKDNVRINVARAGNVIGGGDWSINRIVPDCIRAYQNGKSLLLRNPSATRPWQHVLEPLGGYLLLATRSRNSCITNEAYNFGPPSNQNFSVEELIVSMSKFLPGLCIDLQAENSFSEAGLLKLNCDKALAELGWEPVLDFSKTIEFTAQWYLAFKENPDQILEFTKKQIESYAQIADCLNLTWIK